MLGEVLPRAHHVVIAAPATPGTRHLIGAAELEAMREDAWLVNVARFAAGEPLLSPVDREAGY